jgi:putative phosphoribosyl transferase
LFENRVDAGRKLSSELVSFASQKTLVLAVPNGGLPIAAEVAAALGADLDVIVVRKIVLPMLMMGGLGAVAEDGTTYLNEELIRKESLDRGQVEYEAQRVKENVKQRSMKYNCGAPKSGLTGKTVIIVDDGLASGITMSVAVEAVRHRRPKQIIVAVPLASAAGLEKAARVADKVVCCAVGKMPRFFLADYYRHWGDISDDVTFHHLELWRKQHNIS